MATKAGKKASSTAADRPVIPLRAGPPKRRAVPKPRISHHKNRAIWFRAREAWPLREANVDHLRREIKRAARTLATPRRAI